MAEFVGLALNASVNIIKTCDYILTKIGDAKLASEALEQFASRLQGFALLVELLRGRLTGESPTRTSQVQVDKPLLDILVDADKSLEHMSELVVNEFLQSQNTVAKYTLATSRLRKIELWNGNLEGWTQILNIHVNM